MIEGDIVEQQPIPRSRPADALATSGEVID
jgi:hypothetical protein